MEHIQNMKGEERENATMALMHIIMQPTTASEIICRKGLMRSSHDGELGQVGNNVLRGAEFYIYVLFIKIGRAHV